MNKKLIFWAIILFIIFGFLYSVSEILFPFIFGLFIAYFFDPVVYKLQQKGVNRAFASGIIILLFTMMVAGLVAITAPVLAKQGEELAKALPKYYEDMKTEYLPSIERRVERIVPGLADKAKEQVKEQTEQFDVKGKVTAFLAGIFSSGAWLFNLLSLIFITPIVSFYILRDWAGFKEEMNDLLPRQYEATIKEQINKIDKTVSAFLRGQLNVCLILGTYYAIALTLAGLNFGLLIGFAAGMLCFVPFLGVVAGTAIGMLVAFFQFEGEAVHMMVIGGIFLFGQILEGNILTPKIVGDKIGVHPAWLIFGMLAGGSLLGLAGVIISVPMTAIINVLVQFAIEQYEESEYYADSKKSKRERERKAKAK